MILSKTTIVIAACFVAGAQAQSWDIDGRGQEYAQLQKDAAANACATELKAAATSELLEKGEGLNGPDYFGMYRRWVGTSSDAFYELVIFPNQSIKKFVTRADLESWKSAYIERQERARSNRDSNEPIAKRWYVAEIAANIFHLCTIKALHGIDLVAEGKAKAQAKAERTQASKARLEQDFYAEPASESLAFSYLCGLKAPQDRRMATLTYDFLKNGAGTMKSLMGDKSAMCSTYSFRWDLRGESVLTEHAGVKGVECKDGIIPGPSAKMVGQLDKTPMLKSGQFILKDMQEVLYNGSNRPSLLRNPQPGVGLNMQCIRVDGSNS